MAGEKELPWPLLFPSASLHHEEWIARETAGEDAGEELSRLSALNPINNTWMCMVSTDNPTCD